MNEIKDALFRWHPSERRLHSKKSKIKWLKGLCTIANDLTSKCEEKSMSNTEIVEFSILQINVVIQRLFGGDFYEALRHHARDVFETWKETSAGKRRSYMTEAFAPFRRAGWIDLCTDQYLTVLVSIINSHVQEECKGEFQESFLKKLTAWVSDTVLPFATMLFEGTNPMASANNTVTDSKGSKWEEQKLSEYLTKSLLRALSEARASELFEMIADFPDSIVAIKELKDAATASSSLSLVGKTLRASVCRRLLHTGASTSQILELYVSMIRALRVLDPSDLLLNYVAAPVRKYLMSRKDTVRCIVSSLTESKESDLHGELRRGGSLEYGVDEDDEEKGPGENWEPRKRDPALLESGWHGLDVLALLVSIYGSTDLFVSEYRLLLSDKLMANLQYDTDQELATMELLKMRFGEDPLHSCEVMLRDLEESKRVHNTINQGLKRQEAASKTSIEKQDSPSSPNIAFPASVVDCVIASDNYWPPLQADTFTHHPSAVKALGAYQDAYASLKKPRKLHPANQMGLVQLDLDFEDGSTRSFTVGPVQASLIMHLAENSPQSSSTLAQLCEIEEEELRKKMSFWISRGVVRGTRQEPSSSSSAAAASAYGDYDEGSGETIMYAVIEDQAWLAERDKELGNTATGATGAAMDDEEGVGGSHGSTDAAEKASLVTIEKYIRGMLSSHGSMTLERLHSMLRLLASGSGGGGGGPNEMKFDMNMVQLRRYLQTLVDADKVELIDNAYRIRK